MDSEKQRKLVSNILVNGALALICLLWTIPTIGLLVSSFRQRDDIKASGWWTILPHRGWALTDELPIPEGATRDEQITIEGVTATFDEFREGVDTPDGKQIVWIGNLRNGRIEISERR